MKPRSNNYRFNGINVTNSSFSWSAMDGTRQSQCRVNINRDGTFESNKDCPFRLSGRFEGKKAAIRIKTSERDCDVVAKHD